MPAFIRGRTDPFHDIVHPDRSPFSGNYPQPYTDTLLAWALATPVPATPTASHTVRQHAGDPASKPSGHTATRMICHSVSQSVIPARQP